MTEAQFTDLIESVLEADPNTISMDMTLDEVGWDSLSNLTLIAELDAKLGIQIGAQKLQEAQTLMQLYILVNN